MNVPDVDSRTDDNENSVKENIRINVYVYNSNNVPDRLQLVSSGSIRNFYPVRDFQFLVLVTNVTLQFSCYPQPGCWEI